MQGRQQEKWRGGLHQKKNFRALRGPLLLLLTQLLTCFVSSSLHIIIQGQGVYLKQDIIQSFFFFFMCVPYITNSNCHSGNNRYSREARKIFGCGWSEGCGQVLGKSPIALLFFPLFVPLSVPFAFFCLFTFHLKGRTSCDILFSHVSFITHDCTCLGGRGLVKIMYCSTMLLFYVCRRLVTDSLIIQLPARSAIFFGRERGAGT